MIGEKKKQEKQYGTGKQNKVFPSKIIGKKTVKEMGLAKKSYSRRIIIKTSSLIIISYHILV